MSDPVQPTSALDDLSNMPDPTSQAPTSALDDLEAMPDQPQTSVLGTVANGAKDLGIGFAKGVGDTTHGIGEIIRKSGNLMHAGAGDAIIPPQGQAAFDKVNTDTNDTQHVGKALENVAEFALGEGAVGEGAKALSMGDKLKSLGEIGKMLEKYPLVAKMLASGAKGGVVGGAERGVKTGDLTQAAEGAAGGAVSSAGLTGLGAGIRGVRALYSPLVDTAAGTADVGAVQPVVQKGIRDVVSNVAKDSGVEAPDSSSIRDVVADTADQIKAKSQPVFQKLDELSNGKFSDAQSDVRRYKNALDKAGKDAYQKAKDTQDALFNKYKDQFDPGALDKAKADWKQYRAMQEVNDAVTGSVKGQRPEVAEVAAGAKQPAEAVNPTMLLNKLNKLYDEGTLQQAFGEAHARDLLNHAGEAQSTVKDILASNKSIVGANKAANASKMAGRSILGHVGAGAAIAAGGTALAGYGVRKALSGTAH